MAKGSVIYRAEAKNRRNNKAVGREDQTHVNIDTDQATHVGFVRSGAGVSISENFKSVRVDITVEVPWTMRPGVSADVKKGIAFANKLVDQAIAKRMEEIPEILEELNS